MAITHRIGVYNDFYPEKLKAGEYAVVRSGDPEVADGKAVYICFTPGDVKRIATHEDVVQLVDDMASSTIEELTTAVNNVIIISNAAADFANSSGAWALEQAAAAETAANNADAVAADLIARKDAGEFKGEKGDPGEKGEQGESGVMIPISGMFTMYVDSATGNLYVEYLDGSEPPQFEYTDTGDLYYITGDAA